MTISLEELLRRLINPDAPITWLACEICNKRTQTLRIRGDGIGICADCYKQCGVSAEVQPTPGGQPVGR